MSAAPFEWLAGWDRPALVNGPVRVVGIDLGTTNSTITEVVWEPGGGPPQAEVIEVAQPTREGQTVTSDVVPSVVAVDGDRVLVGQGAYRLRGKAGYRRNRDIFWECKNEIGTRRDYHTAPEEFRTPREIAGHTLAFLHRAAQDNAAGTLDRVVITVPASFQWTQRADTLKAAEAAGLTVRGGELLDEPVAAFLDFLTTHGPGALPGNGDPVRVVVLDFGGGTCDVAVLEVAGVRSGGMRLARRAVSRFHRIGGSDIDDVIAHDILLPRLLEENGRQSRQFSYTQKRDHLLPALSGTAQALKIKLSERISQLQGLGSYDKKDRSLSVKLPGTVRVPTGRKRGEAYEELPLAEPSLSVDQFDRAVGPFLSPRALAGASTEYMSVASVFMPVRDALDRAGMRPGDVDAVMLVGGSALLPMLEEAVEEYFPVAEVLQYREPRDALRCVGRGAAYHALLLAVYGQSPLTPTTGQSLGLRVLGGVQEIVPANAALPFPAQGEAQVTGLRMPDGSETEPVPLRLELVSGASGGDSSDVLEELADPGVVLESQTMMVDPPVAQGDPILVEAAVDENQVVRFTARVLHGEAREQVAQIMLDNPFSVVENPGVDLERLLELEEQARKLPRSEQVDAIVEMAGLCAKLGERERAREMYERALLNLSSPQQQAKVLNRLGNLCWDLRDPEAAKESSSGPPDSADGPRPYSASLCVCAAASPRRGCD